MKLIISATVLFVFLIVSGCGNSKIGRQYDFIYPNTSVNSNFGYLKVFTVKYVEKDSFSKDQDYYFHKGYSVYSKFGDLILDVNKAYGQPEIVKLPEGEYIVIAELFKHITNSFPVVIEKGRILEVDDSMIEYPLSFNHYR
jgi:hypothetical protein